MKVRIIQVPIDYQPELTYGFKDFKWWSTWVNTLIFLDLLDATKKCFHQKMYKLHGHNPLFLKGLDPLKVFDHLVTEATARGKIQTSIQQKVFIMDYEMKSRQISIFGLTLE